MNEWSKMEDNLFSGNHRTKMIANGNGTIAQVLTVEDFEREFNQKTNANTK